MLIGQLALVQSPSAKELEPTASPYRTEHIQGACKLAVIKSNPLPDETKMNMIYMAQSLCLSAVSTIMRAGPQMNEKFRFCPPASATPAELIPIMSEFVDKNPELLAYDIRDVANYVGRRQWPCG